MQNDLLEHQNNQEQEGGWSKFLSKGAPWNSYSKIYIKFEENVCNKWILVTLQAPALEYYKYGKDLTSVTSVYLGSLSIFSKPLFYRTNCWGKTGTPIASYTSTEETT